MGGLMPMPTIPNVFNWRSTDPGQEGKKRVLVGGKMNPMHLGHLKLVETLLEAPLFEQPGNIWSKLLKVNKRVGFDEVILTPDYNPAWLGAEDVASWQDRTDIIRHTTKHNPRIKFSDICKKVYEKLKTETRSIDILREMFVGFDTMFERTGKRAFMAVGADVLRTLDKWKEAAIVAKNVTFVVAERDGKDYPKQIEVNGETIKLDTIDMPFDAFKLSSTDIRKKIRAGEPITGLVHPAAEKIIKERKLWQLPPTPPPGGNGAATTQPPTDPKAGVKETEPKDPSKKP